MKYPLLIQNRIPVKLDLRLLVYLVFGLSCTTISADTAIFRNGDRLLGNLQAIENRTNVVWKHPEAKALLNLDLQAITELQLPNQLSHIVTNGIPARFELRGGESFDANLISLNAEKVTVNSAFSGSFEFPKSALLSIIPSPQRRNILFEGPVSTNGWTMGKVQNAGVGDAGEWMYQGGAFYATQSASVARNVNLPPRASIHFDLQWKGYFHLAIALATDYLQPVNLANKDIEPDFGGFYSLQLNNFSANLLPVKKADPLRFLGQVAMPAFGQRTSAHVDIRVDRDKKLVALLIDGLMVKQWIDPEGFAGTGGGIRFVHQGQGVVKLSGLKITEWDGQFEELITSSPNLKQDTAKLRNGDRMVGLVEEVKDGKLAVTTKGTRIEVPLARVFQIELSRTNLARLPLNQGELRAYFGQGGHLRLLVEKMDATGITGRNSTLGVLQFHPHAFKRLRLEEADGMTPLK